MHIEDIRVDVSIGRHFFTRSNTNRLEAGPATSVCWQVGLQIIMKLSIDIEPKYDCDSEHTS
jgi:hypothetical protein